MEKLVILVGPTASGKTSTAIAIAKELGAEIISADSRYFYQELEIGTAKPTLEEMGSIPHYLIDVTSLNEEWNLAIFQERVKEIIQDINSRGKIPILVGGTGQYIRAVTEGWKIPRQIPDKKIRDAIINWANQIGSEQLHKRLAVVDPEAAKNIDHRNMRRTIRALEVIFLTGSRFSEQRKKLPVSYDLLTLGIAMPRSELYARIDARIDQMILDGFIEEVKHLLSQGFRAQLLKIGPIGYQEITRFLDGEITLEDAILLIRRKTRLFVRRQANWFKPDDPEIKWFQYDEQVVKKMVDYIHFHYSK